MLSKIYKESKDIKKKIKFASENERKENIVIASELNDIIVDEINSDISILFKNEKRIETESNKLQSLINQHSKDVLQWNDLTKMLDNSLKELGDVQNWVDLIERDMKIITSTIEFKCQVEPTQLAENSILRFDTAKYDDEGDFSKTPSYKNHPLE
ncbi:hypothetical protein BCR32DRAFT_330388 [Anaeromyces robustus]|uniref:Biogenesis of lysosome-related organelles complex 1 subunit 1 n=1 Tax=Anaeromyces robustus TaxID=1754192 RepID=A0A1Y1VVJ5_9FUNG|nr:hypothetical protein BCR32DRAFT_330388 [Anaeromyces robustus]|eukprot:ORX65319.1 hypothetical protein BCR32DRAFT_330388 [Anaeromyces robustus]